MKRLCYFSNSQFDVNDVYDVDDLDKIPVNHLINVEGSIGI